MMLLTAPALSLISLAPGRRRCAGPLLVGKKSNGQLPVPDDLAEEMSLEKRNGGFSTVDGYRLLISLRMDCRWRTHVHESHTSTYAITTQIGQHATGCCCSMRAFETSITWAFLVLTL